MEATAKSEIGSPSPRLEAKGQGTANNSESQETIKVCHATDCACTARKGYTCSHQGPCKQITGNNAEGRCPDCGSLRLKFGSRDPCEGDNYWCRDCGAGPIQFPLYHAMRKKPSIIDADTLQAAKVMQGSAAAIAGTPFADGSPFDAGKRVTDLVGS